MFKNLKIAQRLAVLSMLFLIPVAFVLWALLAQKNVEVNFTGREVLGTQYLQKIAPVLTELEERQYDPSINIADASTRLRDAQDEFASGLDTAQASNAAIAATETLIANPNNLDNFQSAQAAMLALVGRIGDRSNLILDNVLDSYYLSDVVLNRMPTLLDRLPDLRQFDGSAAQHDNFMLGLGAASDNRDGLGASLASSIADNADGSVKAALTAPYQNLQSNLNDAISRFRVGQNVSADDLSKTMNIVSDFDKRALSALGDILQAREHGLVADKWETLGVALALFAGALLLLGFAILKQISDPVAALTGAMGRLADSDLEVAIPSIERRDELGDMARATEVFRKNAVRNRDLERSQAMEQANRTRRQEAIVKLSAEFNRAVGGQLGMLSAASTELEVTANGLLEQAGTMDAHTGKLLSAATHSSENAQTVAAATEELSASSREIGSQADRTTAITRLAVTDAVRARDLIAELSHAVGGVTDVVAFIDGIAAQTNLLALNATIEASRAGAAGKGFAVVASEVKALANQTAQATGDIGKRIHAVQTTAKDVTSMIAKISDIITEIDGNSDAIATAVSQQALATSEISMNAQQAALSNDAMSVDITHVGEAATFTKSASGELLGAAGELAAQAAALQLEFGNFIHAMASAGDRRSDPRVDVNIKVALRSGRNGGNQVNGRVVNLSEGGARVTTAQHFAEGERLQIVGLDQAVLTGLVVSSDDIGVRILFQLDAATQKQVTALVGRLLEGQKLSTEMRLAA